MAKLKDTIPGKEKIKNIIFDFGGVLCDLDISRTQQKFKEFGPAKVAVKPGEESPSLQFDKLVEKYEIGAITSAQFRQIIRDHYLSEPSDMAIDETWNALLIGIPERRIRLLKEAAQSFRIFLLSNSNEIHYLHYLDQFRKQTGYNSFDDLFEKAYFSYQVNLSKPGKEIFEHVLYDARLNPAETLFIDDTMKHVEAARSLGIHAYHLDIPGREDVCDLFE